MKKRSMSEKLLAIILGYTIVVTVFNIVCFFVDSWIVYIENPVIPTANYFITALFLLGGWMDSIGCLIAAIVLFVLLVASLFGVIFWRKLVIPAALLYFLDMFMLGYWLQLDRPGVFCLTLLFDATAIFLAFKIFQRERAKEKASLAMEEQTIDRWQLYDGDISAVYQDDTELPLVEVTHTAETLRVLEDNYVIIAIPEEKLELPHVSGWRIDLRGFSQTGKTAMGNAIITPAIDKPPVLCIYQWDSDQLHCLLRSDIALTDIGELNLGDFNIYYDGELVQNHEMVEYIWQLHTGAEINQQYEHVFEGAWSFHCVTLVLKECAAVRYELNYAACQNLLYLENINSEQAVTVPVTWA